MKIGRYLDLDIYIDNTIYFKRDNCLYYSCEYNFDSFPSKKNLLKLDYAALILSPNDCFITLLKTNYEHGHHGFTKKYRTWEINDINGAISDRASATYDLNHFREYFLALPEVDLLDILE